MSFLDELLYTMLSGFPEDEEYLNNFISPLKENNIHYKIERDEFGIVIKVYKWDFKIACMAREISELRNSNKKHYMKLKENGLVQD